MSRIKIGTVGVDAGMMYLGDPCYVIDKPLGAMGWDAFLDALYASQPEGVNANWWTAYAHVANNNHTFPAGMVVTTGWGDGEYPVYVEIREGRVASVTVEFMSEEEEE